jgi:hypothetical protein
MTSGLVYEGFQMNYRIGADSAVTILFQDAPKFSAMTLVNIDYQYGLMHLRQPYLDICSGSIQDLCQAELTGRGA